MNNIKSIIPVFILCLLVTACASQLTQDIEVTAKQQPGVDLGRYRTYAWQETAQIVNDPLGQWEPPDFDSDAEVTRLVERELAKLGMTAATDNPDMMVTFIAGIDMLSLELREDPKKDGQKTLQNIPKGALVVVLIDAVTRVRLWVGVAAGDIGKQPDSAAVRQRLDYAITGMFQRYPAK
jgi:hypothetical protein